MKTELLFSILLAWLACLCASTPALGGLSHEAARREALRDIGSGRLKFYMAGIRAASEVRVPDGASPLVTGFFIDPSSTPIKGGKASLIVGALRHNAGTYIGNYRLKVSPYMWMSEEGTLSMIVPETSLRRLTQGIPVTVTGQATTKKNGKSRAINAKITPAAKDGGSVTFSFTGEDTKLIFKTSYQCENG